LIKLGDLGRTPNDVVQWMFDEVMRREFLDQATAPHEIQMKFGKEFIYENENGNSGIEPYVLTAFEELSGDSIAWVRPLRHWRKRQP
jgi:hypothetical protein